MANVHTRQGTRSPGTRIHPPPRPTIPRFTVVAGQLAPAFSLPLLSVARPKVIYVVAPRRKERRVLCRDLSGVIATFNRRLPGGPGPTCRRPTATEGVPVKESPRGPGGKEPHHCPRGRRLVRFLPDPGVGGGSLPGRIQAGQGRATGDPHPHRGTVRVTAAARS